jgi:superoxide dismutase, Cu-Zn family
MRTAFALLAAAAVLAGCQSTPSEPPRATAQLEPTKGNKTIGEATFEQRGDKVQVWIFVQGLKPGQEHGLHIHEVGDCSSDDGMSAKGHFNPFGKPHGDPKGTEHHAGDLPALKADKGGRAKVEALVDMISVTPGPGSIINKAVIVHADPDDYKTQPTGNAGARLACGVIKPG